MKSTKSTSDKISPCAKLLSILKLNNHYSKPYPIKLYYSDSERNFELGKANYLKALELALKWKCIYPKYNEKNTLH